MSFEDILYLVTDNEKNLNVSKIVILEWIMTSHQDEGREEMSSNAIQNSQCSEGNPTTSSSEDVPHFSNPVNCVARPRDYQKEYICLPHTLDYQKEHMCLPRPRIDLFQDTSGRNILLQEKPVSTS
jgi:hypothetical protein